MRRHWDTDNHGKRKYKINPDGYGKWIMVVQHEENYHMLQHRDDGPRIERLPTLPPLKKMRIRNKTMWSRLRVLKKVKEF